MELVFMMVALSLVLSGFFILAFIVAVRRGQFDDMDSPQHRALFDSRGPEVGDS